MKSQPPIVVLSASGRVANATPTLRQVAHVGSDHTLVTLSIAPAAHRTTAVEGCPLSVIMTDRNPGPGKSQIVRRVPTEGAYVGPKTGSAGNSPLRTAEASSMPIQPSIIDA